MGAGRGLFLSYLAQGVYLDCVIRYRVDGHGSARAHEPQRTYVHVHPSGRG